jgi:23S rRNA (guanosine2251-2'-O)-methyltransferase
MKSIKPKVAELHLILPDVRSTHNVGAILRTAEGCGVNTVHFCGYTPYPIQTNDVRLPHLQQKIHSAISKTALGAETMQASRHWDSVDDLLFWLGNQKIDLWCLEQTESAQMLNKLKPPSKMALVVGNEVDGVSERFLSKAKQHVFLPMYGHKESYNVAQAVAMALYDLRLLAAN